MKNCVSFIETSENLCIISWTSEKLCIISWASTQNSQASKSCDLVNYNTRH